jgi:cytochrome c-type biogenesis protein CcmH/NrfF
MEKKPPKRNSLAQVNPKLVKEWHPKLNGDLKPDGVLGGSHLKVWWKCNMGDDHEWEATVASRNAGRGCPICLGRKIVESNCLATLKPDLAREWHQIKNGNLTPFDVGVGSGKKVWWKCPIGEDHEWESTILNRTNGNNCPICAGQKVVESTSLYILNPKLSSEWDSTKNANLLPSDVGVGYTKKVWWQCTINKKHAWQSNVDNRHRGGKGCPYCANQRVDQTNSLEKLKPHLTKEWDIEKNLPIKPTDVVPGSGRMAWWVCKTNPQHKWRARIVERNKGKGCPYCSNLQVDDSNSLRTTHPKIASQWHPTNNNGITPEDIVAGSEKRFWWKCRKGKDHVWESSVSNRLRAGCPVCSNQKIVQSNSLATKLPKLASEWHLTKNGSITQFHVGTSSNKVYWWKCPHGPDHEWRTTIDKRKAGGGCPFCTLTPQSRQELTITFELKQFFDIDPKGFKTRVEGKLWSIDIYLKGLNLGIEFDGSYWHKDKKDLDKLKTEKLKKEGFHIMRIREEPLMPITEIDVVSKRPFDAKKVTNEILCHIMKAYSIAPNKVSLIKEYLRKRSLQNEEGLNAYVEIILEEKSKKKKKRSTTTP